MTYVTTSELSKMWDISSRMIAYYCEEGRIAGAIKKGKTWLIPANAPQPNAKCKIATHTILKVDENIAIQGKTAVMNKVEADAPDRAHYPGDIYRQLGLTREALRYYEKIGLIEPNRNRENLYREFWDSDIMYFLAIDFHKKRGFSLHETKKLMKKPNKPDNSAIFQKKVATLEQSIYNQQCILDRLKETRDFYEYVHGMEGKFELRDFPLYSVLKSFDDMRDISNFGEKILRELQGEDILSHLVRAISLDENGYKGSKWCVVKQVTGEHKDTHGVHLESGKCIYTTVIITPETFDSFLEKIFSDVVKWETENGVEGNGSVYVFIRLLEENNKRCCYEIWMPIK